MRVLVTGATGFIGRPLIRQLIAGRAEVLGLALEHDLAHFQQSVGALPGLTLFPVDLRDSASTASVVSRFGPTMIVHLAAAGVTDPSIKPDLALQHNVHGTLNLIHAAFDNRDLAGSPRKLVVIRTPGESHPSNAYAASKAAAWSFCQMYARRQNWPIVGAMVFQAYGPGQAPHTFVQAAIRSAMAGENFDMTTGSQERDWVYVDDVVDGLIAALEADLQAGESFDLGTGRLTSLIDVANLAYRLVKRGGQPVPGGLPDRPGDSFGLAANVARSTTLISWNPRFTLEEGLKQMVSDLSE